MVVVSLDFAGEAARNEFEADSPALSFANPDEAEVALPTVSYKHGEDDWNMNTSFEVCQCYRKGSAGHMCTNVLEMPKVSEIRYYKFTTHLTRISGRELHYASYVWAGRSCNFINNR